MSARPRVRVPDSAKAGEVILIRALISHTMESGNRRDSTNNLVPRKIINHFECTFNDQKVFECAMEPAISANPYFEFHAKVNEAGTFNFVWIDDDGSRYTHEHKIEVA
jgi:sulfur-oxidizing protein SoxZ